MPPKESNMHLLTCIKQTPKSDKVKIDFATGCLIRTGIENALNPFDEYALEIAVELKEQAGGRVSVMTMGPSSAEEVLRDAVARGADKAYHLCDGAFAGADTWATSYALAKGAEKIAQEQKIDLIVCGKQSSDSDTGHIGPQISAWLEWPEVSCVKKIVAIAQTSITVERLSEAGTHVIEMPFPCVISVVKEISHPRVRSIQGRLAAKRAEIVKWTAEDIGADKNKLGAAHSPTKVIASFAPVRQVNAVAVEGEDAKAKAAKLVQLLKEKQYI